MILEKTPIEKYTIGDKSVYVKRDDLMGDGINLPPWGKLVALREVLKSLKPIVEAKLLTFVLTVSTLFSSLALI